MEESIKALKPEDAVAFVGSYLKGNAKKKEQMQHPAEAPMSH